MPVTQFNGRTFDREPKWDTRNHKLSDVHADAVAKTPPSAKAYTREIFLDQGQEGGCTGYSDAQTMSMSPGIHKEINNANAEYFYYEAKQYDEYAGDAYEGSSVLGAQKANVANKYTKSYSWAATVEEIVAALAFVGPVQLGINWYDSMFNVEANGNIVITANAVVAGGHAICVGAYKQSGQLFRLDNTWGKSWGQSGSAWLSATDLTRLLGEDGECAVPIKMATLPSPIGTHARVDPGT